VIKNLFRDLGAELSLVSGTGSAVFGMFSERERAERVLEKLEKSSPSLLVETLSRERYQESIKLGV
jgi:4-diphosphocytidyl-2-C-methyl-D-erythritol kinase